MGVMGSRQRSQAAHPVNTATARVSSEEKQRSVSASKGRNHPGAPKMNQEVQKQWQHVRGKQKLLKKGFSDLTDERRMIAALREMPIAAACRALAVIEDSTYVIGEDICARLIATLQAEAAAESVKDTVKSPTEADSHTNGDSVSAAAQPGGDWESSGAKPGADSGQASHGTSEEGDEWQVQRKSNRAKVDDGWQLQTRGGRSQRPAQEAPSRGGDSGTSVTRVLAIPRSALAPPTKPQQQQQQQQQQQHAPLSPQSQQRSDSRGPQAVAASPAPAAKQPYRAQRVRLSVLTPEVASRWRELCSIAKFRPDQLTLGMDCLLCTVPEIAVGTMDTMIKYLGANRVLDPTKFALKAILESQHFLPAEAVPPLVAGMLQDLCRVVGLTSSKLDPRIHHILASNPESFGRQTLEALIGKEWRGTRSVSSYIVSTLVGNEKNRIAIDSLPAASLQLPPTLADRMERLCSVAQMEAWQLDIQCAVILLEMPLSSAESLLDFILQNENWQVNLSPPSFLPPFLPPPLLVQQKL